MTKKDFELIADALHKARPDAYHKRSACTAGEATIIHQWELTMNRISLALETTNDRFKPEVFKRACVYGLNNSEQEVV